MSKTLPDGQNFHRWCEGLGVTVDQGEVPRSTPIKPNTVYRGGRTLRRHYRLDEQAATLAVRCIQQSNPLCFSDQYLWGVFNFARTHYPHFPASHFHAWFREFDLTMIRNRAKQIAHGPEHSMSTTAGAISAVLAHMIIPYEAAQ
jgi:hypothetical protein